MGSKCIPELVISKLTAWNQDLMLYRLSKALLEVKKSETLQQVGNIIIFVAGKLTLSL